MTGEGVVDLLAAQIERDAIASPWLARWRIEMRAATVWECQMMGVEHDPSRIVVLMFHYEDCDGRQPEAETLIGRLRDCELPEGERWTPLTVFGRVEVLAGCVASALAPLTRAGVGPADLNGERE